MFAWDLRQFRLNLAVSRLRWTGGVGRKKGTGIEWQSLHRSWNTQSWKVMELGNRVKNKTKEVEADVKFSLELRQELVSRVGVVGEGIDSYLKSKEESFFEQIKSTRELMRNEVRSRRVCAPNSEARVCTKSNEVGWCAQGGARGKKIGCTVELGWEEGVH
ncbi:hypothetical protein PMAC_000469 [Pneumocystis sp. 'macacae']|nr:hypothetical protein PMAC_000469 [Pneumocystis sp. 'macacae']